MPRKTTKVKADVNKTADDNKAVKPSNVVSATIPKTRPKPRPIATAADADIGAKSPPSGMSVKASDPLPTPKKGRKHGTTIEQAPAPATNDGGITAHDAPPSRSRPVRIRKPTAAAAAALEAAALVASIPKQPSKKALAAQAKVQKEEAIKKSIQALAAYEKKIKAMGFEETPLPPPPRASVAAASGSEKILGITRVLDTVRTNGDGIDINVSGWISDFIDEDSGPDEEDGTLWRGFRQHAQGVRMGEKMEPEEEESEEESGPLYRMDTLTSEANMFISSPSGKWDDYLMHSEKEEESTSDDAEETPIVRKIVVMKGKEGKVKTAGKGKSKVTLESHDQTAVKRKQTKGMLLREQITTIRDHLDIDKITRGTGASDGIQGTVSHGVANYGKVGSP